MKKPVAARQKRAPKSDSPVNEADPPPQATPRAPLPHYPTAESLGVWKPTPEQVQAAYNKTIPDLLEPGLQVLFCGINPSLYSAAVGHNFARPGNRFWPALYAAGFTERRLSPFEDSTLLARGYGMTNLVARATALDAVMKSLGPEAREALFGQTG